MILRRPAAAVVLALLTVIAAMVTPAPPMVGAAGTPALIGTSPDYTAGDVDEQIARFEADVAEHQLGAVRLYHAWDELFPQPPEQFLRDRSTVPVVSISTTKRDGSRVSWRDIGNAAYESPLHAQMRAWADALASFGKPVIITLDHEPDHYRNGGDGQPADYRAAMQRLVSILRSRGATNVETAFIGVAWNFDSRSKTDATQYYPGDNFIDWIAADGYNWGTCRPQAPGWRTPTAVFAAFLDWASDHPNERLMIAEFGSVEGASGQKADWITSLGATLAQPQWNRIDIVLWWNNVHESDRDCDFRADTTPSSQRAFADLFNHPSFANGPAGSGGSDGSVHARTAAGIGRASVRARRQGATAGWEGVYCAMFQQVTGDVNCALG